MGIDGEFETVIMVSPAPMAACLPERQGFFMGKIIFITIITVILLGLTQKPSLAFDRNAAVAGARSIVNVNNTYNVTTVVINAGSTTVGSTNQALPAYQQIAQITAQIQKLKNRLKNFSPK